MASIEKRVSDGRTLARALPHARRGRSATRPSPARSTPSGSLPASSSEVTGPYVDPALARVTVGEWAQTWLDGQEHLKPTTRPLRGNPCASTSGRSGTGSARHVSHADVQAWVTELAKSQSPAPVRKIHRVLRLILDMAVKDGRLPATSPAGVNLPRR